MQIKMLIPQENRNGLGQGKKNFQKQVESRQGLANDTKEPLLRRNALTKISQTIQLTQAHPASQGSKAPSRRNLLSHSTNVITFCKPVLISKNQKELCEKRVLS
jgi:hypothetical protein